MTSRLRAFLGLLFVVSLVVLGCGSTREITLEERNKALVHRMNEEVWNKGNLEVLDELFSQDFVRHFLPNGSVTRGLDQFRDHISSHREAFPDWEEEIELMIAEGDWVATQFTSTGTNDGSFLGNAPTEKQIQIKEMSIYRIVDEKIVEQWLLPDLLSLNRQLGTIEGSDEN